MSKIYLVDERTMDNLKMAGEIDEDYISDLESEIEDLKREIEILAAGLERCLESIKDKVD